MTSSPEGYTLSHVLAAVVSDDLPLEQLTYEQLETASVVTPKLPFRPTMDAYSTRLDEPGVREAVTAAMCRGFREMFEVSARTRAAVTTFTWYKNGSLMPGKARIAAVALRSNEAGSDEPWVLSGNPHFGTRSEVTEDEIRRATEALHPDVMGHDVIKAPAGSSVHIYA
jgi:hypothetical protein